MPRESTPESTLNYAFPVKGIGVALELPTLEFCYWLREEFWYYKASDSFARFIVFFFGLYNLCQPSSSPPPAVGDNKERPTSFSSDSFILGDTFTKRDPVLFKSLLASCKGVSREPADDIASCGCIWEV